MSRQGLDPTDDVLMAFFLIDAFSYLFLFWDLSAYCFPSFETDKFRPQPALEIKV